MNIEQDNQSVQRFLAMARQDLNAANCLYNNKFFPQAVFYLEQSVEKGLKAFAIFAGMITEQEARRSISHQTMKIFSKTTIGYKGQIDTLNSNIHSDPRLERMFVGILDSERLLAQVDRALDFIQKYSNEKGLTISKDDKKLRNYLNSLIKLHQEYNNLRDISNQFNINEKEFHAFKKMLLNMMKRYFEGQPDEFENVKNDIDNKITYEFYVKSMKERLSLLLPQFFILSSFFYLSQLMAPHALSRYPKGEFDPVEYYNEKLPLVKKLPILFEMTERTNEAVNELIKQYPQEALNVQQN